MDDSFGAGGFNSSGKEKADKRNSEPEGVVPLVIKQILDASEDGINLFGMHFGSLIMMGIVRNIEHSSTKITYKIEDHTGTIDAYLWLEEEARKQKIPRVVLNCYLKVHGSVRVSGGVKSVMIFNMAPVKSANEVTTHLLEVLTARYKAEKYSNKSEDFGTTNQCGLNGDEERIYTAIKGWSNKTDGISLKELQAKLKNISYAELEKITGSMCTEGHIYTSFDNEHFLSTDG